MAFAQNHNNPVTPAVAGWWKALFGLFLALFLIVPVYAVSETTAVEKRFTLQQKLEQASTLYDRGNKKGAQSILIEVIDRAGEAKGADQAMQLRAHLMLADLHARDGDFGKYAAVLEGLLSYLKRWELWHSPESVLVQQRLAQAYVQLGREPEALQRYKAALAVARQVYAPGDRRFTDIYIPLARSHISRLEIEKAKGYLDAAEKILKGSEKPSDLVLMSRILQASGGLAFRLTKNKQSVNYYHQSLEIRERILGVGHLETGQAVVSLAGAYKALHRFSEAEEYYRRGFSIYQDSLGIDHPYVATLLNNLGQLYYLQGRYEESEKALLRALEIKSSHFNAQHSSLADTHNHLGYLYYLLERDEEAIEHLTKAIQIWKLPDSSRPRYVAIASVWSAAIRHRQGDLQHSLDELNANLKVLEGIYGKRNISTSQIYHEIGNVYRSMNKTRKAEDAYRHGISSAGQYGQGDWLEEIVIKAKMADLYLDEEREIEALKQAREAIDGLKLRILRHSGLRSQSLATELRSLRDVVISHVDVVDSMIQSGGDSAALLNESFESAQISRSTSAARALSRMAQRFALGEGPLAMKVREREDLLERWQEIDDLMSAALLKPDTERDRKLERKLTDLANTIRTDIHRLDQMLQQEFPDYANLTSPPPLSIGQVQSLLTKDEVMLVYLFGKKKGFLWAISPDSAELIKLAITEGELERQVRRLRRRMVPRGVVDLESIPPLPIQQSYKLYQQILEPAQSLIDEQSHLIVVSDGALQSLPLSVLVTALPKDRIRLPAEHSSVDWLIKEKALSTLPAVVSLSVLRNMPIQERAAHYAFLGFGDPILKDSAATGEVRGVRDGIRGVRDSIRGVRDLRSIIGSSRAAVDIEVLATMPELPETAEELTQVASLLQGRKEDVYLRNDATEDKIRTIPTAEFNTVQFATHGLMAGDFQGLFEPSLILTPDKNSIDPADNGLLTASEITQLEFNADMVVLSACNTAAPDGTPGAEGLSGLGRAFFYAGARTLLLTHWEVVSDAAVRMTTGLFQSIKSAPDISKAEAHRRSALAMMHQQDKPHYAHPMFWAPFSIIGEGGIGKNGGTN
jgi:CHAT domain-containing protein